ncbi:MAG: Poly-beta-1,6-N-acetyl-D-glucosamine synthase [Syntrophus sp. PtaU1.Bin208]|nr:MAG: Poly-beta-1,6-N-acetyl-D-glucosamine synthase [Syntrophus sp. PtaU1.Bin208]
MSPAEWLFAASLIILLYIYVGYPAALMILARLLPVPVRKGEYTPTVSILIAAYNEAKCIGKTIENKLALDYAGDKIEIIVISDGSDDGTDDVVRRYADRGVRLIRQEPRAGKTAALNLAIPRAKGEIIVFSDANSLYETDALRKLLANFKDPGVGYVTGKMIYVNPDGSVTGDGCSAYMRYENRLRTLETAVGSLVGVDGGIDAVRKTLYRPMRADQLPDFVLPLDVVAQGYRVVYEPGAVLREKALAEASDEYRMRVRVSLRAFWALRDMRHLLSFSWNALYAWQLWSHKVLRYLSFVFLAGAYIGNALLVTKESYYAGLFAIQSLGYVAGLAAPLVSNRGFRLAHMIHYFMLINVAAMHAFLKFTLGHKQVVWTPRKG